MSNDKGLADLYMGICFVVTIFVVLPLAFYLLYWCVTVEGFADWLAWGLGLGFAFVFAAAVWRGIRGGLEIRRIEKQTREELADGWTPAVVEEHFGKICGELAREGIFPKWHGEDSIQSVVSRRVKEAGH